MSATFQAETNGILVRATPKFLMDETSAQDDQYVWAYTIEIENRRSDLVQLISRHWRLTDENGRVQEVRGLGVIGQQPRIEPGATFAYSSAAPLRTPSGIMSGRYTMVRLPEGEAFEAEIPAFPLDSPFARRLLN